MRFEGVLQSWNDERGFGFIAADAGGEPLFVHIKAFGPGAARPQARQRISFDVERGPDGKKRACNARPVSAPKTAATTATTAAPRASARRNAASQPSSGDRFWYSPRTPTLLLLIPLLGVLLVYLGVQYGTTRLAALWYGIMSALSFWAYARDKRAAQRGDWRTSERTLLTLGLLCGWPGALLAQQLLRHKSSKASFQALFWVTVALNLGWLCYRYSPLGMHDRWALF